MTKVVCDILDAFGKDIVIIETVGVGQSELDVASTADTTVVVLVPESGDGIQVLKAGLMEIGDLFVVNKSDRPGADMVTLELKSFLEFKSKDEGWQPTVTKMIATQGDGINELTEEIFRHRQYLQDRGLLERFRKLRIAAEIKELVERHFREELWERGNRRRILESMVEKVIKGGETPYSAAEKILLNFPSLKGGC